jgi:hypothetical protein
MNKADCQRLISEYLTWLREGLEVSELESGVCRIATPFLDRHNDELEIYVEQRNGGFLLTDDGYTIKDLEASGLAFKSEKRKAHLRTILNGFGVDLHGDELRAHATAQDFPQKKHSLLQAMLSVSDMFVMGEEHVLSLFKEDVANFLAFNNIPVFPDFKLSGKSGFDHKFDFGLPKTQAKPQRVVQAINNLTKDQALSVAFAVADVRAARPESLGALTFLNDLENPPNEDNLAAIRAYEIEPLFWSRRQEFVAVLNGG